MTDQPDGLHGLAMAVTGGGVDFDSAAGLHAWMKEINAYVEEGDEWDIDPVLALLVVEEGVEGGEIAVATFEPMEEGLKPWLFLTPVGASLMKLLRDRNSKARVRAASFFCEAWGYTVPREAHLPQAGWLPADWKELAEEREEMKTVMTLDVRNPYVTITAVRYRGRTAWEENKTEVYDQGNVAGAMRDMAKFVSRKNRSLKDVKLFRLPEPPPPQQPDQPSD